MKDLLFLEYLVFDGPWTKHVRSSSAVQHGDKPELEGNLAHLMPMHQ
jgi:hypothetical protein